MQFSARNRLPGTVKDVKLGAVMAIVKVQVGDSVIESAITREAAEELKLKAGDKVTAVVKATSVMIMK
ncbi:molybdenum-pterin binding domain protein [Methanocella conradii HZ254]|uniref:Molybdenum-pterin binding domain protein n=1 Tax=Methanocella conradii (strain DSM 24694 / JCM 17849 / CGMCC 1.5162 / HZ254) TaxID=1041930 RepID=H8I6N6_METCZ|nr:TOBE domain-containing protein [Methanocella conradii]AFC98928.1 molybdenum-pterin binding domain protein [Methanocella conradii HZ254]